MIDDQTLQRMTRNEADMSFKKRVQTVFDWVQPTDDKVILDCACGRGFYLNMIRKVSNCKLVGLELDEEVIEKAGRNVGHLSNLLLNRANIYSQPYDSESFDAVILSEILEHIDDDVRGLREVYRVLKPGGVVAITVPHANYPFWWDPINKTLETMFGTHIGTGPLAGIWANHVRLYTLDQLPMLLSRRASSLRKNALPPITAFRSCTTLCMAWANHCWKVAHCPQKWQKLLTVPHSMKTPAVY